MRRVLLQLPQSAVTRIQDRVSRQYFLRTTRMPALQKNAPGCRVLPKGGQDMELLDTPAVMILAWGQLRHSGFTPLWLSGFMVNDRKEPTQ